MKTLHIRLPRDEWWFYVGYSFKLEKRIQRMRVTKTCGYVQLAYGSATRFGRPARRTLGVQWCKSFA